MLSNVMHKQMCILVSWKKRKNNMSVFIVRIQQNSVCLKILGFNYKIFSWNSKNISFNLEIFCSIAIIQLETKRSVQLETKMICFVYVDVRYYKRNYLKMCKQCMYKIYKYIHRLFVQSLIIIIIYDMYTHTTYTVLFVQSVIYTVLCVFSFIHIHTV